MKRRKLGSSDLEVSEISLGSWLTYSGGVGYDQVEACTKAAYEAGINFFDTANIYGKGASEEAWGKILSKYPRSSYVLATKVFFPMTDTDKGLSAAQIAKQIDASLKRLKTDYVDLYQCHRFDPETPIEETMEALSQVVKSGKARYIGFSEWTADQIRAGLAVPGAVKFVSSQPQYHMLWRGPEQEVFKVCEENGISQIVWSPLAQGVLTGKYQPGEQPPADSRAASREMNGFIDRFMSDETLAAVQKLQPIAREVGCTMSQLALAWILRRTEVASAIIGASRPEQVLENVAAADFTLSQDVLDAIDTALGTTVVYEDRVHERGTAILHR
jgi:aryl-alcohol dehydrogenase-like predicted oxidoreductase